MNQARLGLFGGTFDPMHLGHLDVALAAARALDLTRVLVLPTATPPHREAPMASAADRWAMVTAAIAPYPLLEADDREMTPGRTVYTVETLDRLRADGTDMTGAFFITGADAFLGIASWRDYPALLDRCHFVVVSRPGTPVSRLPGALPALGGRMVKWPGQVPGRPSIFLVDAPTHPVSSTAVREAAVQGRDLTPLVPAVVAAYIRAHGLYGAAASGGSRSILREHNG